MAVGNDLTAPPLANQAGTLDYKWITWFNTIYERLRSDPFKVYGFAVADLNDPSPTNPLAAKNFANTVQYVGTVKKPVYTNIVFVINESGGPTLAFSNGVNWLRVQDRAIIT